ncbi:Phenylacetaldehyde dehydrogenase [Serratia fonticola]|uniref:Phenylacetaldehyde dehydrogenase n=1 Tax=Serratia fonticola TaxID=47917 RepID=A0A4U9W989_SERFO|nr:Phenylacetaldehyde dehydrogenase [Serratia fonticola]
MPSFQGEQYSAFTRREPLGVVVGIIPWNFSIMIAIWKLAAALTCGCTVVLKPSEYTPLTMLRVAELATEAGIPAGALNVINGSGARLGLCLSPSALRQSDLHRLGAYRDRGGESGDGTRDCAYHAGTGGKNAAAFLADVSVDKMVDGIIEAGYLNQGRSVPQQSVSTACQPYR